MGTLPAIVADGGFNSNEVRGPGNNDFSVAKIASYVSRFTMLMPDDIITTGPPPGVSNNRVCDSLGIHLPGRRSLFERLQRQAGFIDAHDGRHGRKVAIDALRIGDLRNQTAVCQRRRIAVAEIPCTAVFGQRRLDRRQALFAPMAIPCILVVFTDFQISDQIAQHAQVVQRMNVTSDR